MPYVLINVSEKLQNQQFSNNLNELKNELLYMIDHDCEILKLYNITNFDNIYVNYVIYEVLGSTNHRRIMKKYMYSQHVNNITEVPIEKTPVASDDIYKQEQKIKDDIDKQLGKLFESHGVIAKDVPNKTPINFELKETKNKKGSDNDEDKPKHHKKVIVSDSDENIPKMRNKTKKHLISDDSDSDVPKKRCVTKHKQESSDDAIPELIDSSDFDDIQDFVEDDSQLSDENLKDLSEKLKDVECHILEKKKDIEHKEKECKSTKDILSDLQCDARAKEVLQKQDMERAEKCKNKYSNDLKIYRVIKDEIKNGKKYEKDISPLFRRVYDALKKLDDDVVPDTFENFLNVYIEMAPPREIETDDDIYEKYYNKRNNIEE